MGGFRSCEYLQFYLTCDAVYSILKLWTARYLCHCGRRISRTVIQSYSTRRHLQKQDQGYHYNIFINPYTTQGSVCDVQHITYIDLKFYLKYYLL